MPIKKNELTDLQLERLLDYLELGNYSQAGQLHNIEGTTMRTSVLIAARKLINERKVKNLPNRWWHISQHRKFFLDILKDYDFN